MSVKLLVPWGLQMSLNFKTKILIWVPAKLQSLKTSSVELEVLPYEVTNLEDHWTVNSSFCVVSASWGPVPVWCCSVKLHNLKISTSAKRLLPWPLYRTKVLKILNEFLSINKSGFDHWSVTLGCKSAKCLFNGHPGNKLNEWWFTIKMFIKVHDWRLNQPITAEEF